LKFFLSLYGHKLPALAIDSSDDDTILASGGADKSIKIFGLDFGDTHKTLYGHSDSITDLRFVRKTHYFFTASKDLTVRYWDADRFEQILLLNGHFAEVNCLAVSRTGAFVLSGGMDRQIRVWERTKDMVFLDEEKERALEEMFDKADGARGDEQGTATIMRRRPTDDEDAQMDDMDQPQSAAAVKRSVLSISSGDRIMEAIELADQETKDLSSFNRIQSEKGMESRTRTSNPLLMGMTPPTYILWVLRSIDSAELEQSLMVLPLRYVERVLYYLIILLSNNQGVEICTRTAVFIIKVHQNQIISNRMLSAPLRELRRLLKIRLAESRDAIGFNIAGIRMISKVAMNKKSGFVIGNDEKKTDIWAGLGLGSDVAAALQSKKTIKNK
jgi:U3 small nucleolar RNA-associated protein 12